MVTVSSGQTYTVSSGQTDIGDVVLAGGTLDVLSGGVISSTTDSGNVQVGSGGTAFGTTVNFGGVEVVLEGSAVETIVNSGGILDVIFLGSASSTTVNSGGFDLVSDGATTSDTLVEAGGVEIAFSGGLTSHTVVLSGGVQVLDPFGFQFVPLLGGFASNTTLDGGVQVVFGRADSTTINSGGIEVVGSAGFPGVSVSATINSGGFEFVAGGDSYDNMVSDGGTMFVTTGLSFYNQVESGGVLAVYGSGALAAQDAINSGGNELISGGGEDAFSVVSGAQIVENGGFTSGSVLADGGLELVQSGGDAISTIMSGGLLVVRSGGIVGSISFGSGGGVVELDYSQGFNGTISGFASPAGVTEAIDLVDITFGTGTSVKFTEAAGNTSGTLTVTDGTHTANLTLLGQYSAANFSLSSDGNGGTLITDPAVTASASIAAPQHA
jgi:autotransporter passenger strand-loop-strand repeat protein